MDKIETAKFLGPGPNDTFRFEINGKEELVPRELMGVINESLDRRNNFIRGAAKLIASRDGFDEVMCVDFAIKLADELEKRIGGF